MALLAGLSTLTSGCATLPSAGPTGKQILNSAKQPIGELDLGDGGTLRVVELGSLSALPGPPQPSDAPLANVVPPPTDMIGPGDVLDIAVYEAGVTLFGGAGNRVSSAANGFDPSVQVEKLPPTRVSDSGDIGIPYAGRIRAAGHTIGELQESIRRSLRRLSQNPQVVVSIREAITNTVLIAGEVSRPGRTVLQTNYETVSDAIALAGGYRGDAKDLAVRVQRGDRGSLYRLNDLLNGQQRDMRAYPGDRLTVVRAPYSFTVLGGAGKVEQFPFSSSSQSLTEAIALAGGTNPNLGDPKAVFVFRFVTNPEGKPEPVVYHLNMMTAGAYFISQRFGMVDKDVVYVGNASANQPTKVIQLISQLFSPIVAVTSAAQTLTR